MVKLRRASKSSNACGKSVKSRVQIHIWPCYPTEQLHCNVESPAQLLMSRQLRTRLPRWTPLSESISSANSDYQKRWYDRTAKQMPALQPGNTVRMRTDKGWALRGTVKCQVAPRSYKVSAENGGMYVRNRRHLLQHQGQPRWLNGLKRSPVSTRCDCSSIIVS